MFYASIIIGAAVFLIIRVVPQYGQTNVMVYIAICSLVGSLSVCCFRYFQFVYSILLKEQVIDQTCEHR